MGSLQDKGACDKAPQHSPALLKITPEAFFDAMAVNLPGETQCMVLGTGGTDPAGGKKTTFRNLMPRGEFGGAWAAKVADGKRACFWTPFTYASVGAGALSEGKGRTQANARRARVFYLDIDAGEAKHAKNPEGTYPDGAAAETAVNAFVERTGLVPSIWMRSGTGGVHLYFLLDTPIGAGDWLPRAKRLEHFCKAHGLKVDPAVTKDPARFLAALADACEGAADLTDARGRIDLLAVRRWFDGIAAAGLAH